MATLVLLKYNNYYNRIVKQESSVYKYRSYQIVPDVVDINFIPNDNINTEVILNLNTFGVDPDYLLVIDADENIKSRWFIISATRVREGQFKLELHRDLIVDYYAEVTEAPCFIEKATVPTIYDPAVYNNEDITFNQIKQAEYPLKDKSGVAWIVGYVPKDSFPQTQTITSNYAYKGSANYEFDTLSEYDYYNEIQDPGKFPGIARNVTYKINTFATFSSVVPGGNTATVSDDFTINMNAAGNYTGITAVARKGSYNYTGNRSYYYIGKDRRITLGSSDTITIDGNGLFENFNSTLMKKINSYQTDYLASNTQAAFDRFIAEDGKIIYNRGDGQYYKIKIRRVPDRTYNQTESIQVDSELYDLIYNNLKPDRFAGTPSNYPYATFAIKGTIDYYAMTLQLLSTDITVSINGKDSRYHLNDSPYDMFCIPFPAEGQEVKIYKKGQVLVDKIDRGASFSIATAVTSSLGSANLYDLQLLPYCPIPEIIKADGTIDVVDFISSPVDVTIDGISKSISVLFWALSSQFSIQIPFSIPAASSIIDKKVKNETEFWRLCSPNYSGLFEFNPEKNNGVSYIDIDCTYKPFSPYIHACINFNDSGLYGSDFNDSRGLVCGGDFSLPIVTNAWADYQLNNKNYQQMFDRQIQNMEVNNAVQKEREIWSAAAGTLSAGVSGATSGFLATGNPLGALAGVATAGLSLAGGVRDLQLNDKLRNEALDYKRDMYGYQLGNIKALPQGLAKVSAYTANNKIFPFLEKYGCTDIEVQALKNKIKYNGMTIMRIGTIGEFIQSEKSYIKGRLIRLETIPEDYHIVNAIADEIYKGVFI